MSTMTTMTSNLANASRAMSAKTKSQSTIASAIREQQPIVEAARDAHTRAKEIARAQFDDDLDGSLNQKMTDALKIKNQVESEFNLNVTKWHAVSADLEAKTAHYHVKKKEADDAAFDAAQLIQAARARDAAEIEDIIQRIRYAHSPSRHALLTAPSPCSQRPPPALSPCSLRLCEQRPANIVCFVQRAC